MNKLNLPPFYVGQKVVANCSMKDVFKKGEIFTITGVYNAMCLCDGFDVTIGILPTSEKFICHSCNFLSPHVLKERVFSSTRFSPIQQQNYPLIKLSKIMEKEKEEILIPN